MMKSSALCCVGLALLCTEALAGQVQFDGQNSLQGELKRLERGMLYFKTPATDTISIEWDNVDSLSSPKNLEIELDDGRILYGSVEAAEAQGQISIRQADGTESLPMASVVRLTEIEDEFRARFDGSISAGVNLTGANDYESYNFGLDTTYTTKNYVSSLNASSRANRSADTAKSEQSNLNIRSSRRLKNRWYTGGLLIFDRNEELGIDLRSSIGVTVGKSVRHTNSQILHLDGGFLYSQEEITGSPDKNDSQEAFLGLGWEIFRYDDPELDLSTSLVAIPSLSESGRVRAELDVTLKWEIIDDLYWQLSFQGSYDNEPPSVDASTTDYSVISGLAYDL